MEQLIDFLIAFFSAPATPYIFMTILSLLIVKSGKVKTFRIGNLISFEGKATTAETLPPAITNSRDVKEYHLILQYTVFSPYGIIADIRYRVRRNGWEKRLDWEQYKEDAIKGHKATLTQFLDTHYPDEAKVGRIELFEANKELDRKVWLRYERMYDTMYNLFQEAHKEAEKIKAKLQDSEQDLTIPTVIEMVTEIRDLEGVSTRELCMNEAERGLREIMQLYYSHYLGIYTAKCGEAGCKDTD